MNYITENNNKNINIRINRSNNDRNKLNAVLQKDLDLMTMVDTIPGMRILQDEDNHVRDHWTYHMLVISISSLIMIHDFIVVVYYLCVVFKIVL